VAIAPKLDPMFMLDAMRAGVNECIASPVTGAGLEAAIARVMAQRPVTEPASTFAFIGAKGGVGSTTLAVNVATVISQMTESKQLPTEMPPSTLLMDLHLAYGDCTVFLGRDSPSPTPWRTHTALARHSSAASWRARRQAPTCWLLPTG
jgi:pilus assembly protein CpaE